MNTRTKRGYIVASIACLALSSSLCLTVANDSVLAENAEDILKNDIAICEQTLKNVVNDVECIVKGYNDTYGAEWTASSIEYSSPIFLIEDNKYGMYLDFDAYNGYAVITTDKKIYGLQTTGDLEYLRDGRELYFSYSDGFMYVDADKQFKSYEQDRYFLADEIVMASASVAASSTFSTRAALPDGKIDPDNLDKIVEERYPGFVFNKKINRLTNTFDFSAQIVTSYYIRDYGKGIFSEGSEGNCSLNAMYMVMRNWGKQGYIKIPYAKTDDISESILNDSLYATYGKGTKSGEDSGGKYVWTANNGFYLSMMPVLYSNIRSYALNNGYVVNGYELSKVPATMEYVANFLYGNKLGVEHTTDINTVTSKLSLYRCSYLCISGSSTYGNHAVAVIGYYRYEKGTQISNSYTVAEYKYFYEIADGESYSSQIFDPNTSAKPKLDFYYLARC